MYCSASPFRLGSWGVRGRLQNNRIPQGHRILRHNNEQDERRSNGSSVPAWGGHGLLCVLGRWTQPVGHIGYRCWRVRSSCIFVAAPPVYRPLHYQGWITVPWPAYLLLVEVSEETWVMRAEPPPASQISASVHACMHVYREAGRKDCRDSFKGQH